MKRRNFLKKSLAAGSTALTASAIGVPVVAKSIPGKKFKIFEKHQFNLHYAPHFGMFKNMAGDYRRDHI